MAYCAIADVRALNPQRTYSATSKPSTTQVEGHIDDIAGQIDTVLKGRGLTTPVTTPAAFVTYLEQVNAYGAAALAEMGMFPEAGGVGATPQGDRLWKLYSQAMKYLQSGDLPSAIQSGDPASFFTEHPITEPTEDYDWRKPKFGKDKEF